MVHRTLAVRLRRDDTERLLGRAAIAAAIVAVVLGLDQVLPAAEHVDARWLGLLLAVMAAAWISGPWMALAALVVAIAAIGTWLLGPDRDLSGLTSHDLVALGLFAVVAIAGAGAVARLRPRDPGTGPEPAVRDPADPDPLTARELTVLGLLARGLSNDEIAGQLVVSPNTVKTHLEHLYGKLGVTSRGRAVAEGRSRGLIG